MSSNHRCRRAKRLVAATLITLALFISSQVWADDSSCIVCHTDIDLLEENLGEGGKKKSPLQAGAG